jgi:hypothetical protein
VGRDRRADERREQQEHDEADAAERQPVALEADPDELPVPACLDLRLAGRRRRHLGGDQGLAVGDLSVGLGHSARIVPGFVTEMSTA